MKKINTKKKGFTIVELVIVIAVIGILAAILIPTFINLNNKARVSNTTSFLKNVNTQLAMKEANHDIDDFDANYDVKGRFATNTDAKGYAKQKLGYDFDLISPFDGNEICWDKNNKKFGLIDYSDEANPVEVYADVKVEEHDWQRLSNDPQQTKTIITNGDPLTLKDNFSKEELTSLGSEYYDPATETLKVSGTIELGNNPNVKAVEYKNTGAAKEVVIQTNNGGKLTIDGENDTVRHYGEAQVVTLTAVGTSSYYENGSVEQVNIKKGRLVLTNNENASVGTVYLQATGETYDNIILATQNGAELPELIARDNVPLPTGSDTKTVVTIQTNVNAEGKNPDNTETINLYPTAGTTGNDVYEATNGYNVSDLAMLVVEASSTEAKAQAEEQISNSELLEKVNEVKSAYEVSNQTDMDGAITNKAKFIKFLSEFTADHLFLIDFNTTIDGCGFKLTSSANRVFRIAGNNREVTFRNLDMISTFSNSDSRVISVDSNYDTMHLTLDNCKLECKYYALNITGQNGSGTRNLKVDVYGCTIKGYAAINNHASSSMIKVNNSTLIGYNGFNAGSSNSFATIVFDGGNYEYEGSYTFGNKIEVNNSTLKQVTLTTNYETVFSSQYGNISSEAHFNNCSIEYEGDNAQYFNYAYEKSSNVKIYIDGELYYEGR